MSLNLRLTHVRFLAVLVAMIAASVLLAGQAGPAAAQAKPPIKPVGGLWCGVTNDGGPVFLQVSADGRFVEWVDIATDKGSVSTRERNVQGVTRAQIASSKYIFRQRRDERVCRRGDERGPRDPREQCTLVTLEDVTIRGTFTDPNRVRGSFSGQQVIDPSAIDNGRGRLRKRLLNGSYEAWAASSAPCP